MHGYQVHQNFLFDFLDNGCFRYFAVTALYTLLCLFILVFANSAKILLTIFSEVIMVRYLGGNSRNIWISRTILCTFLVFCSIYLFYVISYVLISFDPELSRQGVKSCGRKLKPRSRKWTLLQQNWSALKNVESSH